MKLNIVPARTGFLWVKLGIRTYARQPLALTGLFFMFVAAAQLATLIPYVGSIIALMFLPFATVGFMAATREVENGKFPMPAVLFIAMRGGRERTAPMLSLGGLYALGILGVMGISALIDGGTFASIYLLGGQITKETAASPAFQTAWLVSLCLYAIVSMVFWHAPALVHWYRVPPVKALFYSLVACLRNFKALTLYTFGWFGVFILAGIVLTLIPLLVAGEQALTWIMMPLALVLATMFFSSIYFTFRDSFVTPEEPTP